MFESGSGIYWMRSDGAEPTCASVPANSSRPWSFSPDGRRLAYYQRSPEARFEIWTLPLDLTDPDHPKPGNPEPFVRPRADEIQPRFSPDGRWIAYRSNESGSNEIYVRPFPNANAGKWQISSAGGLYALCPTTAASCSMRPPTTGSWWWITRWMALPSCRASRVCGRRTAFLHRNV